MNDTPPTYWVYRVLHKGEQVQLGDEIKDLNRDSWSPVRLYKDSVPVVVGETAHCYEGHYRRRDRELIPKVKELENQRDDAIVEATNAVNDMTVIHARMEAENNRLCDAISQALLSPAIVKDPILRAAQLFNL